MIIIPARIPSSKIRRAARAILFKSRSKPGVKGWELYRLLGEDFLEVVKALNNVLEPLGLTVKAVGEGGVTLSLDGEKRALKKAVFVAVLKEPPTLQELRTSGWRIDDVAILATSLLYLTSSNGRVHRKQLLDILHTKFDKRRVTYVLEKLLRMGYLEEEGENIVIGWRSKIEVDFEKLVGLKT